MILLLDEGMADFTLDLSEDEMVEEDGMAHEWR